MFNNIYLYKILIHLFHILFIYLLVRENVKNALLYFVARIRGNMLL